MTNPIATFCTSAGVATTTPSAWSLADLQALVGALIEATNRSTERPGHVWWCARGEHDGECNTAADPIIRAAEGVTLEPGEYRSLDHEDLVFALKVPRCPVVQRGRSCWLVDGGEFQVTAVRRVSVAAPEPVAAPLVERAAEIHAEKTGLDRLELDRDATIGEPFDSDATLFDDFMRRVSRDRGPAYVVMVNNSEAIGLIREHRNVQKERDELRSKVSELEALLRGNLPAEPSQDSSNDGTGEEP